MLEIFLTESNKMWLSPSQLKYVGLEETDRLHVSLAPNFKGFPLEVLDEIKAALKQISEEDFEEVKVEDLD